MAVCQFFLRGQCRFGDTCRNEHPASGQQGGFGNSSWNKASAGPSDAKLTLPFTAAHIKNDLTASIDKPIWPLSSYAPAKHEPLLLAGLDESPEELRVKAFTALQAGNLNDYLSYETTRIAAVEQIYGNARTNSEQAYEQAVKQSKLPALIAEATTVKNNIFGTGSSSSSTSSAFGNPSTTTPSAFGPTSTPSAFGTPGNTTSAFGKPAFGQPAFGQSAFGQPAFGQPAFGQTSTPATTSAFGQPQNTAAPVSAFSQPQQPAASAFGQPSQAAPVSAFGQPSLAAPASAFGQPSQTAPTSAFGQPSAFGQAAQSSTPSVIKPASGAFSAFSGSGPSAFANAAGSGGSAGGGFSAFAGQTSAFGLGSSNAQTSGSVFGQPAFGEPVKAPAAAATTSAFGTPAQGTTSVFGAPSAFNALAQQQAPAQSAFATNTPSAFNNTNMTAPTSVFGQQSAFSNPTQPVSAFGNPNQGSSAFGTPSAFGTQSTTNNLQPLSAFAPTAPSISMEMKSAISSGPLDFSIIKGTYKPGSTPYDQQLPPKYLDLLPKSVQEAFQSAKFEWGKVPEWVPPLSVR